MPKTEVYNGTEWESYGNDGAIVTAQNEPSTPIPITGAMMISSGTVNMNLGSELNALSAFSQNGIMVRTDTGNYTGRSLIAGTGINITNADGVADNPIIGLGIVPINTLENYPNDANKFLNGAGQWQQQKDDWWNILPTNAVNFNNQQIKNCRFLELNSPDNTWMGIAFHNNIGRRFVFETDSEENGNFYLYSHMTNKDIWRYHAKAPIDYFNINCLLSMTGNKIENVAEPTNNSDAATKNYVDNKHLGSFIRDMNFQTIYNLAEPILGWDAATKNYVDNKVGSKLEYITTGDTNFPIRFTRALHVDNYYDSFIREYGTYGYLNSGGGTGTLSDSPIYDIKCNGRIRASEVNVWSSKNIKNILARGQIIQNEAANLIQTLPTVKYNYKDPSLDGKGNYYGMISEEIKDYLPDYVTSEENKFAPNIMKQATATLLDYNTIGIIIENAERDYPDIIDKKIQIIAVKNACQGTVLSILGNTITVKTDFALQLSEKTIDVFVYGTYEDCPTIAKMHLFDMALCALQNCLSRIQQLENKV